MSVLRPVRVSTPPPLMVTLLVAAMVPFCPLCWMAVALFRMRSPGTTMAPTVLPPLLPPMLREPWLTTVAPV